MSPARFHDGKYQALLVEKLEGGATAFAWPVAAETRRDSPRSAPPRRWPDKDSTTALFVLDEGLEKRPEMYGSLYGERAMVRIVGRYTNRSLWVLPSTHVEKVLQNTYSQGDLLVTAKLKRQVRSSQARKHNRTFIVTITALIIAVIL